jgi:hypothetical protein
MTTFRFCRVIEDRNRQYLVRAANNTLLVGRGEVPGPTCALVIDTWLPELYRPGGWVTARTVLYLPSDVAVLQALECFGKHHAREVYYLLVATQASQLTREEQAAAQKQLTFSVGLAILERYGAIG